MSFFNDLLEIYDIPIFSKGKLLKKLRSEWEKPAEKWRDFSKIETLLKLTALHHKQGVIDDKTWHDLGMNAVFSKIDTTLTGIGQQTLYRKMHLLEVDKASLSEQYDFACNIQFDQTLREQLQTTLYPLSLLAVKSMVKSLFDRFHFVNLPKSLIVGWNILSIIILFCSLYFQSGFFYFLAVLIILTNLFVVRPRYLDATDKSAYSLHCMSKMLSVSHALAVKKNSRLYLSVVL